METLDVVSSFGRWVEVLLEGPSDQDGKQGSKLSLKSLRMGAFHSCFRSDFYAVSPQVMMCLFS